MTGAVTAVQVGSSPRCRSCHAAIWFGLTEKGRRMPMDPGPTEDGNVVVVQLEGRMETEVANLGRARAQHATEGQPTDLPRVRVLRAGEHIDADMPRYVSHFATCAMADRHRRPRDERAKARNKSKARAMGLETRP